MTVEAGAGAAVAGAAVAGAAVAETFDINKLEGEKFHALFPEEIRAKPYMKDINTFADFTKKFDGAQTLIGQRVTPAEDAPVEEWNNYFAKAGRPEKPENYVIPEIEGVPKEFVTQLTEKGTMAKIFHAGGLNNVQAKIISTNLIKTVYEGDQKARQAADASFEKTMETIFGRDRAAVIENGKKMLAAYIPENVKTLAAGLDDNAWAVLLAATEGIVRKHVREDGFRGGGGGGGGVGADTKESISAAMRTIMAQPEYGNPQLNKTKNAELNAQMEDFRVRLRKIS